MEPDLAIARLREVEREIARLHALQAELLVAAAAPEPRVAEYLVLDPRPGHDEERLVRIADVVREEIACALRWSPSVAQVRIDAARLLCGPLTSTRAALARGDITHRHAMEVVESATRLPGHRGRTEHDRREFASLCARLEERVLRVAVRGTVSQTRAAARRSLLAIDADGQARRRRSARCTRDVYVVDELDGISTLVARLATEQAHAVMAAVRTAAASADPVAADDTGGAGERRADAFARLVLGAGSSGGAVGGPGAASGAAGGGAAVRLDVVVGLDQLLGDDPSGSVELRGSGSVSLGLLCALLDDPKTTATMRRLVVDPFSGHLLDVGRRTYEVPRRLRDYIALRDRTCRFPGCGRRADRCQVDHALPWNDGGATSPGNLGALCQRHHQLKTHGDWQILVSRPDGSCTWRSPAGHRYEHPPSAVPDD
jgi:hypothetical protein